MDKIIMKTTRVMISRNRKIREESNVNLQFYLNGRWNELVSTITNFQFEL